MKIRVLKDADAVAQEAARLIASLARKVVIDRGRFVMAVSGGKTPWQMLRALVKEDVPWKRFHLVQVDERIAPSGHADRNLTHLRECFFSSSFISKDHIYAMPVESSDLESAAKQYALLLSKISGTPPVLDLVHLGLGPDGHTASLIPGDPILQVEDKDVGITGIYQGRKRMTITYPMINRARNILWIVTGAEKATILKRMLDSDPTIPAGLIFQDNAYVIADNAAFGEMTPKKINKERRRYDTWDSY
jgi:6-phosphogluconolactonase